MSGFKISKQFLLRKVITLLQCLHNSQHLMTRDGKQSGARGEAGYGYAIHMWGLQVDDENLETSQPIKGRWGPQLSSKSSSVSFFAKLLIICVYIAYYFDYTTSPLGSCTCATRLGVTTRDGWRGA